MKQLQTTWLVQRLQKPHGADNYFAFGGGLKNGGLSESAMSALRGIFSFDYMGAAEYEFGAIPQTFESMAKRMKSFSTFQTAINKRPVYVIGETVLKDSIITRLNELAKNKVRTKGSCCLDEALGLCKFFGDRECRTIGWLEIDNGFMFFTDQAAFNKTAALFGLNSEQEVKESDTTTAK